MTMSDDETIKQLSVAPMTLDVYPAQTVPTPEEIENDPSLLPGVVARQRINSGFESGARFQCMCCDREWHREEPCVIPVAALAVVVTQEAFRDADSDEWPMLISPLCALCAEDISTLQARVFAALQTVWPTLRLHPNATSITSEAKH